MRSLWRTTASLLRKHPILWLPVVLAEVLTFNFRWLERILRQWLTRNLLFWFSQEHSVLSNSPVYGQPSQQLVNKAIYLAAPLEWGTRFLSDVILACALVATAAILRRIFRGASGTLREALAPIAASSRRILIFCLKLYGLNILGLCVMYLLGTAVMSVNPQIIEHKLETYFSLSLKTSLALERMNLVQNLISFLWAMPITLCIVYAIAPLQLRLIQSPEFNPTPGQKKQARLAAICVTLAIAVLSILVSALESTLFQQLNPVSGLVVYSVRILTSLIIVLPYVPLYIALFLIANPETPLPYPLGIEHEETTEPTP